MAGPLILIPSWETNMSSSMYLRRFKFLDETCLALLYDGGKRASLAELLLLERRSFIALMSGIEATVTWVRRCNRPLGPPQIDMRG
jgi:hypothetical protein